MRNYTYAYFNTTLIKAFFYQTTAHVPISQVHTVITKSVFRIQSIVIPSLSHR